MNADDSLVLATRKNERWLYASMEDRCRVLAQAAVHALGVLVQQLALDLGREVLPALDLLDVAGVVVVPVGPVGGVEDGVLAQDFDGLGQQLLVGLGMDEDAVVPPLGRRRVR